MIANSEFFWEWLSWSLWSRDEQPTLHSFIHLLIFNSQLTKANSHSKQLNSCNQFCTTLFASLQPYLINKCDEAVGDWELPIRNPHGFGGFSTCIWLDQKSIPQSPARRNLIPFRKTHEQRTTYNFNISELARRHTTSIIWIIYRYNVNSEESKALHLALHLDGRPWLPIMCHQKAHNKIRLRKW